MAIIESYGLSVCGSTSLGKTSVEHLAKGLSENVSEPLGEGALLIAANGLSQTESTALGEAFISPGVDSVVALESTKIRLTFDSQMTSNAALVDLDNYEIAPTGAGVPVYKSAIEAEDTVYPNYVDISISEMTDGQSYQASVETGVSGPTSKNGEHIGSGKSSALFTGLGIKPQIKSVESLSKNAVKVTFTEAMEDNAAIRNKSNYTFDNGLSVLAVTEFSVDSVFLETSDQTPGLLYTITITS